MRLLPGHPTKGIYPPAKLSIPTRSKSLRSRKPSEITVNVLTIGCFIDYIQRTKGRVQHANQRLSFTQCHRGGLGRFSFRLRHRRHLGRGADHSGPVGFESEPAWAGDGLRVLRHRAGLAAGRLARGPLRPQEHAFLHRLAVHPFGSRLRPGQRSGHVHRRPLHRRAGHRHLDGRGPDVHFRNRPAGLSRAVGGHVPVQHRLRHRHRLCFQCDDCPDRRRGRLALDARHCRRSFPRLRPDVPGPSGKPAMVDQPQGRPRGGP